MLMFDLQKGFDTVDHDIVFKKLKKGTSRVSKKAMGVKFDDRYRSYLSHQNQVVHVNDTVSDPSLAVVVFLKVVY